MSFKQFIPDIGQPWDEYWKKTSIRDELELVESDGLLPIFNKFLPKKGRILEAGCGLGKWIITLDRLGYTIEGVDNNRFALDKLTRKFHRAKVKMGDVKKLTFKDESFAAYISLGVVEHFEEGPDKALAEAYRVLNKGAVAIVEVPFDSPLRKLTRYWTRVITVIKTPVRILLQITDIRKQRKKRKMRFYEYRYEQQELRSFMEKAGFTKVKIFPKDDLSHKRSISLWLDYPVLQKSSAIQFELNPLGSLVKRVLEAISPFSYCALVVAVGRKE